MLASKLAVAAVYGVLVVILPPTSVLLLGVPIALMLLVTLWMLPDRETFPMRAIEWLFPLFFAFNVLWPVYIAVVLPGLPWLTPTRMLLFVLVFLLLYSVSSSGVLRRHLMTVVRSSPAIWWCFIGWEVTQLITLPLSKEPGRSFKIFVDNQFADTAILFFACLLFTQKGWARRTIVLLISFATLAAIDGFVELKMEHPPWAEHIPSFMRVDEALMASVLGGQARAADGIYRVHGMSSNSLIFAEFLALCTPFILHWIFTARKVLYRFALAFVFILVTACIVVTQSRLGLVGVFISLLVYPALWALRRWRSDRTSIIGPAIVLGYPAIAAMMMLVVFSSNTLTTKMFGGGAQAASDQSRRTQRVMAMPKIVQNPLGYGLGRSGITLGFVSPSGVLTVDNGYISTLLDLGIAGFVALHGMFLFAAWHGARLFLDPRDPESTLGGPLATSLIMFVVIRSVLAQQDNYSLVFMFVGATLALLARSKHLVAGGATFAPVPANGTPNLPASSPTLARITG